MRQHVLHSAVDALQLLQSEDSTPHPLGRWRWEAPAPQRRALLLELRLAAAYAHRQERQRSFSGVLLINVCTWCRTGYLAASEAVHEDTVRYHAARLRESTLAFVAVSLSAAAAAALLPRRKTCLHASMPSAHSATDTGRKGSVQAQKAVDDAAMRAEHTTQASLAYDLLKRGPR